MVFPISNQMGCFWSFYNKNGHLKISVRCISRKYKVWGLSTLWSLNLKKGTWISYYQSNKPTLKFIQSLLLYIPYMAPGHNLWPFPWGLGGGVILRHNFQTFQLWWTIWLPNSVGYVWANGEHGRGVTYSPITFDYEIEYLPFEFPIEWTVVEFFTTTNGHLKISIRCILEKYHV